MPFRLIEKNGQPVVWDSDTGISLREKFYKERSFGPDDGTKNWPHHVYIFNDPAYRGKDGSSDIEFYAHRLERQVETNDGAKIIHRTEWYGFEIDEDEFEEAFGMYAEKDPKRLSDLKNSIRSALITFWANTENKKVEFKKGVNSPRKRYGWRGGLVQPIS